MLPGTSQPEWRVPDTARVRAPLSFTMRNSRAGSGSNFRSFSSPNDKSHPKPSFKRIGDFEVRMLDTEELCQDLVSDVICSIHRPNLLDGEKVDINFTEFRPVASYTWIDGKEPVMLVPGHPRIWAEELLPFKINRDGDTRTVFDDEHHNSRLGTSPLLPMIVAVNHHDPNFRMGDTNFITDRNGLRKLYRWVNQPSMGSVTPIGHFLATQPFRIDVEVVGKTIVLQRWEAEWTQFGSPGYERNFEQRATSQSPGCEAGTEHYRIVTFNFGGTKILMRYLTDACLPPKGDPDSVSFVDLIRDFTSTRLQKKPAGSVRKIATHKDRFLSVHTLGKLVPQDSIIELRTKSGGFSFACYHDIYVQLLFAQVPNFYIGRHTRGEFHTVEKTSMEAIKEQAGDTMDDRLKLLKKILDEIQRVVLERIKDGGSLSIVVGRDGTLKVLRRKRETRLLPDNVRDFIH